LGGLVETLVFSELTKLLAFGDTGATLFGLRDNDGREVDFILEERDGRVTAIEVKASTSVTASDARHLKWLRDKVGERFVAGAVLYFGQETYSLGDRLVALPMSSLWGHLRLG
jgi:predicted AAA+ superfamily ATPase